MLDYIEIEKLIENCLSELSFASLNDYDDKKADRTAALFLNAQMQLSLYVESVEMGAKVSKNEVSRIEGEKYFEYKTSNIDKKITENMISAYVSKDVDIVSAKKSQAEQEALLKKITYLLNTLKDGHIYFRNLAKNKTWQE